MKTFKDSEDNFRKLHEHFQKIGGAIQKRKNTRFFQKIRGTLQKTSLEVSKVRRTTSENFMNMYNISEDNLGKLHEDFHEHFQTLSGKFQKIS